MTQRFHARQLLAWVSVICLGSTTVRANVELQVFLDPSGAGVVANVTANESLFETGEFFNDVNFWHSSYSGSAAIGQLGASTMASVTGSAVVSGDNVHSGASTVRFRIDDLVITNLFDPEHTDPIAVSTNFSLDGVFSFTGTISDRPSLNHAGIRIRDYSAFGFIQESGSYRIYPDLAEGVLSGGIFAGLASTEDFAGIFATPDRIFQVGIPQVYGLELITSATTNTSLAEARMSSANFLSTLMFTPGLPVFNLPAGYTANSADGYIVNNIYSPPSVPEPASMTLLAIAGLALGWRLRNGHSNFPVSRTR